MMEHIITFFDYVFWFVVILSIVVFIHEFGHYFVARRCGVRVEVFSIGFGREIFGWNDSHGTRWKFSILPFGGYVKMYGDSDPASAPDDEALQNMSFKERGEAFHFKSLRQKAAIVFAGPAFNYITAIVIIFFMYAYFGKPITEPQITKIVPESAAEMAGLKEGDVVMAIDGEEVETFEEIRQELALNLGTPITMLIERGEQKLEITVTPKIVKTKDIYGNEVEMPMVGIASDKIAHRNLSLHEAMGESVTETYNMSMAMFKALGQIIAGDRSIKQLGGPVKIAQYSGQSAKIGVFGVLWFIALISINLGMVNLFPLPMLDGGHLLFYGIEAVTGKPVPAQIQIATMKVTFALLMTLMIYVTFNDISALLAG